MTKTYSLRTGQAVVNLTGSKLEMTFKGKSFYALYDFQIESVPEAHIDLMVYLLFFGLGENRTVQMRRHTIQFPERKIKKWDCYDEIEVPAYETRTAPIEELSFFDPVSEPEGAKKRIVAYSGGYDSTSLLTLFPDAVPVFLKRHVEHPYDANQMRVVSEARAHVVPNNFEELRMMYGMSFGFNHYEGYVSLLMPYFSFYEATEALLGKVLDGPGPFRGIANEWSNQLVFGEHSYTDHYQDGTKTLGAMNWFKKLGLDISLPIQSLAELNTSRIVERGVFAGVPSSCHSSTGNSNHCMKCYKCFRKAPCIGLGHKLSEQAFQEGMKWVKRKPVYMPLTTAYALQRIPDNRLAPYLRQAPTIAMKKIEQLKTAHLERYDDWHLTFFCSEQTANEFREAMAQLGIEAWSTQDNLDMMQLTDQLNCLLD